MRDNGLSVVRILAAFFFIETDDIAAVLDPDFLDFERSRILGIRALRNTFLPLLSAPEHREINFLLAAHPYPNNVTDRRITAFQCRQRFLAHHPTIAHHSYFPQPEAFPHPFDNRHQGGDVGGVAGPHLTANRATFHIDGHPDHHLLEIGSVVLIVTALADLSALAFKVERSGVEKD